MITLKQAEAFYWVAQLGSVVDAAERLNLAQSTLSKRILELEAVVGVPLFVRGNRTVIPTRLGEELVPVAADLLAAELRFREAATGPRTFSGPFRLGVTELVALTWLPRLMAAVEERYPQVVLEPEVDASGILLEKLTDRRLDLVVGLNPPTDASLRVVPLGSVTLDWVCAPGIGPRDDVVLVTDVAKYPVLTQGEASGVHKLLFDWFRASGVRFNRVIKCSSVHVLTTLAQAGLGITFVPAQCVRSDLQARRLRIIRTVPALPPVQYFAIFHIDAPDGFNEQVARIVQACCDFASMDA
jgi:DNA-binding transcriptional LysR family regulator